MCFWQMHAKNYIIENRSRCAVVYLELCYIVFLTGVKAQFCLACCTKMTFDLIPVCVFVFFPLGPGVRLK